MGVLSRPEVAAQYQNHYIGVHADFSELELIPDDPRHATVERHNNRKWRPLMVFLDAQGKEVFRHRGKVQSAEDALLIDRYVNERLYAGGPDFKAFSAQQKGK